MLSCGFNVVPALQQILYVDEKFDWNCESGGKLIVFIESSSTYFRLWNVNILK